MFKYKKVTPEQKSTMGYKCKKLWNEYRKTWSN